ncbi:hypothetical protein [Thiohalorhabdus sp.]|uniref:hypothetical protein n=1 Tax=Thiohalorhabdus sp. TaxID=3094134 RepID=UPI002FC3DFF1
MRYALGWILMVALLLAQSAWAFEGHVGHFEGDGTHQQAPVTPGGDTDTQAPSAGTHCGHSPVHFVAVHRDHSMLAGQPVSGELPPYRAPVSSLHAEPPTQPPRG